MRDRYVLVRHPKLLAAACAVSAVALLSASVPANAFLIPVIDVIPNAASAETGQNSEPSIAVDPLNPLNMVVGTFTNGSVGIDGATPYWSSSNGGLTWSSFGILGSVDKSLAWRQDGVAPLTVTLNCNTCTPTTLLDHITTYQGGTTSFGAPINISAVQSVDQPWIRTGPGGQTYVTSNNFNAANAGGRTASIAVSSTNGASYSPTIVLETVAPAGGQDAPSVRSAVNGSTVYAAFTRWGAGSAVTGGAIFSGSQVVVVKSTNSGASFNAGVSAATTTGYFSTANNSPLTLGQERTGSDVAIAVAPNNANRVVVAYGDRTGTGQLQLKVVESTDGGTTWSASKFTTSASVRSALPGLTITQNGDVALLFASYDSVANSLSQHLVTTTDDFATTTDSLLGTASNTAPTSTFEPYLGDFYDLTSVDNELFGAFSASNFDNGTLADYPDAVFQRCTTGVEGTASFGLCNNAGGSVNESIDPWFFALDLSQVSSTPEPATLTLLGTSLLGLAALRRRRT